MRIVDVIAAVLLVVGGLNWGLVGLFQFDLVAALTGDSFGSVNIFSAVIYSLVGLAAVYQAVSLKGIQQRWNVTPSLTAK